MPIEAIGGVGQTQTTSDITNNNAISQEDFIELFLAQLNFQDPLEPLNNREFLAQLAQFSSLEQTRQTNENLEGLLAMNSSNQALDLLGRDVEVLTQNNSNFSGVVEAIHYNQAGAQLTVQSEDGEFLDQVSLSQIRLVQVN